MRRYLDKEGGGTGNAHGKLCDVMPVTVMPPKYVATQRIKVALGVALIAIIPNIYRVRLLHTVS